MPSEYRYAVHSMDIFSCSFMLRACACNTKKLNATNEQQFFSWWLCRAQYENQIFPKTQLFSFNWCGKLRTRTGNSIDRILIFRSRCFYQHNTIASKTLSKWKHLFDIDCSEVSMSLSEKQIRKTAIKRRIGQCVAHRVCSLSKSRMSNILLLVFVVQNGKFRAYLRDKNENFQIIPVESQVKSNQNAHLAQHEFVLKWIIRWNHSTITFLFSFADCSSAVGRFDMCFWLGFVRFSD